MHRRHSDLRQHIVHLAVSRRHFSGRQLRRNKTYKAFTPQLFSRERNAF